MAELVLDIKTWGNNLGKLNNDLLVQVCDRLNQNYSVVDQQ